MKLIRASLILAALVLVVLTLPAQERSDSQIRDDVLARVKPHRRAGDNVTVAVQNGVVTLSGAVSNLPCKQNMILFTRRTLGVREVVDKVTVVPAQRRSDEEITRSVNRALDGNLSGDERKAIRVRAENGAVILAGTLASSYPKQVAGLVSSLVPGVTEVRNEIAVRPREPRADPAILADVRERLRKNAFVANQKIDVSVSNGVVTLAGTVDTFRQAEQAEAVARFTPGVVDVRNNLYVRQPA